MALQAMDGCPFFARSVVGRAQSCTGTEVESGIKLAPHRSGYWEKKKATDSSGGKKTYDIKFYILFEKLSCIFCWNVGTHYIFHLFGFVFFLGSFTSKRVLCVFYCVVVFFSVCVVVFSFSI